MTSFRRQPGVKSWYGEQLERASRAADLWNERHPLGTLVDVLDEKREVVLASFRTTGAARETAGAASLFCPVVGWVPLRRVRIVPKSQITDGPEGPLGDDLPHPPLAPVPPAKPGESPSDDGDDRRAMVRDEGRAEVGHPAVGDGSEVVQGSQEGRHRSAGIAGSTPAPASHEQRATTAIRVLCSLLFSGGSLPLHRLADRCNLTPRRCGQALSVLHDAGLVENQRHGHWRAKRLVVALHRELVSLVTAQVEARHERLRGIA